MKIIIKYLCRGNEYFEEISFKPEEYFDPLEEWENGYNLDTIPKLREPWNYLTVEKSKLIYIEVNISIENRVLLQKYTFWNDGKKRVN